MLSPTNSVTASFSKTFTDATITAGSTLIKAVHIMDLRSAIDTLRSRVQLLAFNWTDQTLTSASTPARQVHLVELRTAFNEVYQKTTGVQVPTYTDQNLIAGETAIRAIHLEELRAAVRALE